MGNSGQWTVDSGKWTVDSGQWTVDSGQWTVDSGQWTEMWSYIYFVSVVQKVKILKCSVNIVYGRECREVKGSGLEIGIRKGTGMKGKMEGLEKGSYQWAVI